MKLLERIIGDPNEKYIKKHLHPKVARIRALEEEYKQLSDEQLQHKTQEFRDRLTNAKTTLDDILPEAYAVVRHAAMRTIGMRHYDVQLIGGMVLHEGNITEMRTGEGKTLVATLPVYLNALTGKGVHVVTVNDYLARRDAVWMGKIYDFLGMSTACIQHEQSFMYDASVTVDAEKENEAQESQRAFRVDYDHLRPVGRKEAYAADITYGTNNEFGFDYLRDNMAGSFEQMVQRECHFAIVDEVDSILIDEARTPLIISAPDPRPIDDYYKYADLVSNLKENEHYNVDEKLRSATLTEAGIKKMESALGMSNIYSEGGLDVVHHLEQALKARALFKKDKDYVVRENEVVIVDEFTGRLMHGRRYSEGLHQAIEAKERVAINKESRTLATITFQNLFRMYPKLSGMTGTAETEAEEFRKIYGLEVFVIPTNKPIARIDSSDRVYKNRKGKFEAAIKEIKERLKKGQPVLVGTISIEQNEYFSQLLTKAGVQHEILNAKNHEREAEIIAQAGRKGSVTLATNMAGRGVDIVLGGNPCTPKEAQEVKDLGGLHVLGTERHESRRIDNQLRGRSGRQGDPGSSQFYVSLEDELMRIFGSDRLKGMMQRLGVPDDMPIENKMVSRSIESAQKKVEGHNFDTRKHLVEYDDVINRHREAIYRKRRAILEAEKEKSGEKLREMIFEYVEQEIAQVVNFHTSDTNFQDWNVKEIEETMRTMFPPDTTIDIKHIVTDSKVRDKGADAQMRSNVIEYLTGIAHEVYKTLIGDAENQQQAQYLERAVLLHSIDRMWMDHLQAIDNLRTAVGLRGYGQRDPLVEYKRESYLMFQQLLAAIQNEVAYAILKAAHARSVAEESIMQQALRNMRFSAPAKTMNARSERPVAQSDTSNTGISIGDGVVSSSSEPGQESSSKRYEGKKIGRNDPCPCGSGKKFKKCHGA